MNIHSFVDTFTIILLFVVSLATAQHSWDSVFGFHRHVNYDMPRVIEIQHPRMVRIFDDDYRQSLRLLHLYEPFDPPQPVIPVAPVVYLPRIHIAPEVYVEESYPFVYNNRFQDPPPYLNRLQTTLSFSYRARVLRVVDKDENEEAVADSLTSDSNTVPQEVTTVTVDPKATSKTATKKDGNGGVTTVTIDPKATSKSTTKKDGNGGTSSSTPQSSVKKVTPKAEPVTKPDADQKPDDGKTTEPATNLETTKDNVVDSVPSEPVKEEIKNEENPEATTDSTTPEKNGTDENAEPAPTESTDGSTADVPTE